MSDLYVDNTMLSVFRSCREKARLSFQEHLKLPTPRPSTAFGSSWHAALDAMYSNIHKLPREECIEIAKIAFLAEARKSRGAIPLAIDNIEQEKRSMERGIGLVEAYFERWKAEPWQSVINPVDNKPYVEMPFAIWLMEWNDYDVYYVGVIDRIMKNRIDGRLYNIESKTTTQGLGHYIKSVRPNHQISGYQLAAKFLLHIDIVGTCFDCTFVSSRQPNPKGDKWLQLGIDIEKDFARVDTRRSPTELQDFLDDTIETTTEYLEHVYSKRERWNRNTTSCSMYGGCAFTRICNSNNHPSIKRNFYRIEPWEPWKAFNETKGGDKGVEE